MDTRKKLIQMKRGVACNCRRCNRVFTYYGFGYEYCPACKSIDEVEFNKVKQYIYEHGISKMIDVVENTGVSEKTITRYLKEGRLEIPENSSYYLQCERCKREIRSGRFCNACAQQLIKEFNTVVTYNEIGSCPKDTTSGKMRFLYEDNRKW